MQQLLGWLIILIGIVSTISGITGGIIRMIRDLDERPKGALAFSGEFIKAMTELLSALVKAPTWLALVIIGFILIIYGGTLIA